MALWGVIISSTFLLREDDMMLSQLHEFHFIITRSMKERLKNFDVFKGFRSLSGIIVKVLSALAPILRREHKWGEQQMSRYMPVCDNPDEIREHVHVYLPEDLYRELKLMHQDLNVFSIAQIVRKFLEIFLGLCEKYGNTVFKKLEKMYSQWKREAGKTSLTQRQYLRQLWKILLHIQEGNRTVTVYDRYFSPFWILRC